MPEGEGTYKNPGRPKNKRTGPDFLDKISDNTHRTDGKKKLLDMMKKNWKNRNKKKKK